jgi:hypothetical protein
VSVRQCHSRLNQHGLTFPGEPDHPKKVECSRQGEELGNPNSKDVNRSLVMSTYQDELQDCSGHRQGASVNCEHDHVI